MDCPHIPLTPYSDFSQRLHQKVVGNRIPLVGSMEVTERCNLSCAHCYINLPAGDQRAHKRELNKAETFGILDQIVDQGCLWLLLTGGEPFVRPDFLDIYTYAKKKGLLITLFTNGTTISPRIVDHLVDWRPFTIEITLYGCTKETYEKVTGVSGSYEKCIRGIELLLDRGLPLKLKSMAMTLNHEEIWDMQSFATSLGVEYRFDPVLNVRLDGGHEPTRYRLPPDQVVALDLADEKRLQGWRDFQKEFAGAPSQSEYLYQCGAGNSSFHIDAYGQLSTCIMARSPSYDLRQGTFVEGWDAFFPQVRKQKWTTQVKCQTCELSALCGQCPGWSQMESGDQQTPVDYLCQIAHQRADAFGFNGNSKGNNL